MAGNLVPIDNVAERLGLSVATIRVWIRQGHIPKEGYIKAGNTYRFDLEYIMDHLRSKQDVAKPETPAVEPKSVHITVDTDGLDFDL